MKWWLHWTRHFINTAVTPSLPGSRSSCHCVVLRGGTHIQLEGGGKRDPYKLYFLGKKAQLGKRLALSVWEGEYRAGVRWTHHFLALLRNILTLQILWNGQHEEPPARAWLMNRMCLFAAIRYCCRDLPVAPRAKSIIQHHGHICWERSPMSGIMLLVGWPGT